MTTETDKTIWHGMTKEEADQMTPAEWSEYYGSHRDDREQRPIQRRDDYELDHPADADGDGDGPTDRFGPVGGQDPR